jgi:hypothetical protein
MCPKFSAEENAAICTFANGLYNASIAYNLAGSGVEVTNELHKYNSDLATRATPGGATLPMPWHLTYTDAGLLFDQSLTNEGGAVLGPGEVLGQNIPFPPLNFPMRQASKKRLAILSLLNDMFTLTNNKYTTSPAYTAGQAYRNTPDGDGCKYKECGGTMVQPQPAVSGGAIAMACGDGSYRTATGSCQKCPKDIFCNGTGLVSSGSTEGSSGSTEGFQNLFNSDNSTQWTLFTNLFLIGTIIYLFAFVYSHIPVIKRKKIIQIPMIVSGLAVIIGAYQFTKYPV